MTEKWKVLGTTTNRSQGTITTYVCTGCNVQTRNRYKKPPHNMLDFTPCLFCYEKSAHEEADLLNGVFDTSLDGFISKEFEEIISRLDALTEHLLYDDIPEIGSAKTSIMKLRTATSTIRASWSRIVRKKHDI
jgi:hypothetical protein